tara:strand:- start:790 stop:1386 length:597 start_codon:yes stop_codon:yes gene_type:complete
MTTTTKKRTTKKKSITAKPQSLDLPKYPFVFEVLDLISRQRTKAKKIEVLKKYEEFHMKVLFIWNFDESVISVLPPGEVPYSGYDEQNTYNGTLSTKLTNEVRKMHETGSFSLGSSDKEGHTTIRRESRHFYRFIKGGQDDLSNLRRESMFINILEGLHPLEAEIICLAKDKKLSEVYKITKEVVQEAYPDIQWGGRS